MVLSTIFALAAARPGAYSYHAAPFVYHAAPHALIAKPEIHYQKSIIEEPTVAHVGTVVKHIPTAVSHQSSTIVHSSAKYSEPIFAPAVKHTLVSTPIFKTSYHAVPAYAYAPALHFGHYHH